MTIVQIIQPQENHGKGSMKSNHPCDLKLPTDDRTEWNRRLGLATRNVRPHDHLRFPKVTHTSILEIRRGVDRARVVILIQCRLEWCACGTWTGSHLAPARTHGSTTHEVVIIVGIVAIAFFADPPDNNSNCSEHDSTADTHNNTDYGLLRGRGETRAARASGTV